MEEIYIWKILKCVNENTLLWSIKWETSKIEKQDQSLFLNIFQNRNSSSSRASYSQRRLPPEFLVYHKSLQLPVAGCRWNILKKGKKQNDFFIPKRVLELKYQTCVEDMWNPWNRSENGTTKVNCTLPTLLKTFQVEAWADISGRRSWNQ